MNKFREEAKILAIFTVIGLLVVQFGVNLNLEWYNETVELVITLLTLTGIVVSAKNDPTTRGIDNPFKKK
jgi:uncharacterized membrane protein